jgi:hypothetical protein
MTDAQLIKRIKKKLAEVKALRCKHPLEKQMKKHTIGLITTTLKIAVFKQASLRKYL